MTFKPAHKETDPAKAPGQIKNDITLGDYITRKQQAAAIEQVAAEKKLTFEEWYDEYYPPHERQWPVDHREPMCRDAWNAGQENK